MQYKKAQKLAADLRELADFIEKDGAKLPVDLDIEVTTFVFDDYDWQRDGSKTRTAHEKMQTIARVLRRAEKHYVGDWFDLTRRFGSISMRFTANRNKICRRVVVGTKEVPAQVIEARTEEIVEWICDDPLLAETAA